ncbi:MAG TPA: CHAD domain-containing protein [Gemmatimonadaceae bacterium]|nr:CHAD domain-containing protein [Gemmatimonadaceae bacterium]
MSKPTPELELTASASADAAASALALRLLDVIEEQTPGTLADRDPECLHDLRVAVRRTRSLQRELKKVFPKKDLKHFRREFRWLQQATGPTRDLDVYLIEFGDFAESIPAGQRPHLDVMRDLLEQQRVVTRAEMVEALESDRTQTMLADWRKLLDRLPSAAVGNRPHAARPIGDVAARRIDRVFGQMVTMGSAIDDDSPHAALHDLRKKGKELRYLLEFFSPIFPADVTKPMVRRLKKLQDVLGRFQDREVQAAMISELRAEVGDPAAISAMDALISELHDQQAAARAEFGDRFAAFAAPEQRALAALTFRPD